MRLLLVEDEAAIACRIRESLEAGEPRLDAEGVSGGGRTPGRYTVDWARDGVEALAAVRRIHPVHPKGSGG